MVSEGGGNLGAEIRFLGRRDLSRYTRSNVLALQQQQNDLVRPPSQEEIPQRVEI
jgi:hypothetical protein